MCLRTLYIVVKSIWVCDTMNMSLAQIRKDEQNRKNAERMRQIRAERRMGLDDYIELEEL